MSTRQIINITGDAFSKYGIIIGHPIKHEDSFFKVLITEPDAGWRIAIYEIIRKSTRFLENHPSSNESFEPLAGTTLLIVSENKSPQDFEVFLLDKPVCLYKGIWHQIITLSEYSQVKITENLEVNSEFYHFENELTALINY